MRTVSYRLSDLSRVIIPIGKVAENEATQVRIDSSEVFADYPTAVPSMSVLNPSGESYPVSVSADGVYVLWNVKDSDLTAEGDGEFQLSFTVNTTVVKSSIGHTHVCRSIVAEGEAPDPIQNWLDDAEQTLAKIDSAIPEGGTTGQVLAKKSNTDFDTEWVDQTGGGGGGTSDYTQLTNKPQIAGVTLTGNKSLHDLGAAAESDIPDVSSFYTKPSGGIPATDIAEGVIPDVSGFYTKPSGGIPASDLASAVQTSLGKADTAYQKPGSGIPASDIASGVIPEPTSIIDDTAGDGDTNKVWSADKSADLMSALNSAVPTVYTVGTGKDFSTFTAMLIALENDNSNKVVYVDSGVYDIFEEMGGAEYMEEIAPTASQLNWRDVCHVVPPNTKIVGLGNVVLEWKPTAAQMISTDVARLFSPLNISGSCEIENINVVAQNCMYPVHDETSGLTAYDGATHIYRNCSFTLLNGSYGGTVYGAGHNKLMTIIFENCTFDSQKEKMIWSTHDQTALKNDNSVFTFNNCIFKSTKSDPYVRFSSSDTYGRKDIVQFNNCVIPKIMFVTTGNNAKQGYDVTLIGCTIVEVEYADEVIDRYPIRQYNTSAQPIPCTGISLNSETATLNAIDATTTLTATKSPSDTTDTVVWSSSDTSVAVVSNGTVTAKGFGNAVITVVCGGYSATCSVTVSEQPEFIVVTGYVPKRLTTANDASSVADNTGATQNNCGLALDSNDTTLLPCSNVNSVDTSPFRLVPIPLPEGCVAIRFTCENYTMKTRIVWYDRFSENTVSGYGGSAKVLAGNGDTSWDQDSWEHTAIAVVPNVSGINGFAGLVYLVNFNQTNHTDVTELSGLTMEFLYELPT